MGVVRELVVFLTACFVAPSYSVQEVKVILTHPQIAEVDYHITMFTMCLSEVISSPVSFNLKAVDENIAFPLQKNITFGGPNSDSKMPKVVFVYANAIGKTDIKVTFSDSAIQPLAQHDKLEVVVVNSLFLKSINAVIGWVYFF